MCPGLRSSMCRAEWRTFDVAVPNIKSNPYLMLTRHQFEAARFYAGVPADWPTEFPPKSDPPPAPTRGGILADDMGLGACYLGVVRVGADLARRRFLAPPANGGQLLFGTAAPTTVHLSRALPLRPGVPWC